MNDTILDKVVSDIENKDYDSAISRCSELINKYPDNYNLYEIRSGCYYAKGNYDFAINDLSSALYKSADTSINKDDFLKMLIKRANMYLKKQDWKSASDDYLKILDADYYLPAIHNSLSICYRRLEKYNEALFHSSKAINLKTDYSEAYNNRANINICLEKYEEAITDYTRSININPDNAKTFFNRGSIYYEIYKDIGKTREDFNSAIKLNPDYEYEIFKYYPELKGKLVEPVIEEKPEEIITTPVPEEPLKPQETEISEEKPNVESGDEIDSLLTKIQERESKVDSEKTPDIKTDDEIVVPEMDFKSVFTNQDNIDENQIIEQQNDLDIKPVISDDVKQLHEEITSEKNDNVEENSNRFKGFIDSDSLNNDKTVVGSQEGYIHQSVEPRKSFLRTPFFYVIIFILMTVIIALSVMKYYKSKESVIVSNDLTTKVDTDTVRQEDTLKQEEKSDTSVVLGKEEIKSNESENKSEEVKIKNSEEKTIPLETKNLGYISDKKQFVLFSEPDGYYVQIGSYKEKSKAEEKLKLLTKNNIKGTVTEADLKEKGLFYRVRAGAFKSPEEAKEITLKLE